MLKCGKNKRDRNRIFSFCAFPKNRRGWIEIVEAVFSIFLIAGVLLIIVNKNSSMSSDISERVYNIEISILKEIQTNDTIRTDIANAPLPLPLSWADTGFPDSVKNGIKSRIPDYLNCTAEICLINEPCSLGEGISKDVYSQSIPITTTLQGEIATAIITADSSGKFTGITTITNSGSGYVNGANVSIIGGGSGASATITATNGEFTGITTVSNGGSGYTSGSLVTINNIYRQLNLFCWQK